MIAAIAPALVALNACKDDNDLAGAAGTDGRITMHLVDSPSTFDAVTVAVTSVEAHLSGTDSLNGWIALNHNGGLYDLLTLRNGVSAVLADTVLPPGDYTQIRLIVGTGSSVTLDGIEYPLEIPSGMQTGIKLNHPFTIEANRTYELTLDFDAERSVVLTGSGTYQLQPVIRLQANVESGSISGTIYPPDPGALIYTIVGADTVSTHPEAMTGYFKLMALPAGPYTVVLIHSNPAFEALMLEVEVAPVQNIDLGVIVFG
jgi:hypothetical protein